MTSEADQDDPGKVELPGKIKDILECARVKHGTPYKHLAEFFWDEE